MNFFWFFFLIFGFPCCCTYGDLSIDVSITNVGLISTKPGRFLFSGYSMLGVRTNFNFVNFELFWKEIQIFGFPWCSNCEDLFNDVLITVVGLILTKPRWFLFSGYGQTERRTDRETDRQTRFWNPHTETCRHTKNSNSKLVVSCRSLYASPEDGDAWKVHNTWIDLTTYLFLNPFGTAIWNNFIFSKISFIITYFESTWYAEGLKKWKLWEMKNYNVASAVTVSEERGVISGKYQWLPEMPTGKTELYEIIAELYESWRGRWVFYMNLNLLKLKVSCLILDTVKRRAATAVAVSTEKGVNLSQNEATEWWPEMPTEKLTQNELHD